MELQYGPNKIWMENEAGTVVAEVDFVERNDGNYDIVHTFVDDSLRGQGAAAKLVKAAADEIRRRHKKKGPPAVPVVAPCSATIKNNRFFFNHKEKHLLFF